MWVLPSLQGRAEDERLFNLQRIHRGMLIELRIVSN
jgi:hypothetical protein